MRKTLLFFIILLSQQFYSQADCTSALSVCGNSSITYSPNGIGLVNESLGGCLSSGEHNSIWYKITIATSGTLTFDLVPNDPNADYDWAMYGPNVGCGNLGAPIRCNAATVIGVGASTGLNMTSTITNGPGGSLTPYCQYLNVLAGETYYLYIDNWVGSGGSTTAPFSLTWGGTATLASPFTDPALQPYPFIPPGNPGTNPSDPREVVICSLANLFDFNILTPGILNGNTDFLVTYHLSQNDALSGLNPISAPITINTTSIYYYSIHYNDPNNSTNPLNSCRQIGAFKFILGGIVANDAIVLGCNNNNKGQASFNLTSANVYLGPNATITYYPTLASLNAGTGHIVNPSQYLSAEGVVYAFVKTDDNCSDIAEITLNFYPDIVVNDDLLKACTYNEELKTGVFNLSTAQVSTETGVMYKYFPSINDATNGTNEIVNFTNFISPNGVVYVRVISVNECFNIAKITLEVIPPVYSSVLKNKTICIEDRTVLDAGSGFDDYEWSNGETTQSISGVGVGTYWVKLKTGDCIALQKVNVYASQQPVIVSIDINNSTISINADGGVAPYQYSMDGVHWQNHNTFANVNRGDHVVYLKDASNCEPIAVKIVVPNLINVITPNGDGVNDMLDYTALSHKKNLVIDIYDRYGNQMYHADQFNNYKWDGTVGNKKVATGNYWYLISWNENNEKQTPIKYKGWILVKNRE